MKELIKVKNENDRQLVSGRELHEVLRVQQDFSDWIKKQLENVDAIENEDFTTIWHDPFKKVVNFNGNVNSMVRQGNKIDYVLTLDIAKEICMCVGVAPRTNEETRKLSKQVRKYFIECEKQVLQVTRKDRLRLQLFSGDDLLIAQAHNELVRLEVEEATAPLIDKIETDKPKVDAFDQYMNSDGTYTTRNACKMLELSEKKVFAWLRIKGLLFKNKTQPTALAIDKGYFKVIMKHGYPTMTITPLGIEYIRTHYKED